jgi:SagB-type dehydrogenase family enzyme
VCPLPRPSLLGRVALSRALLRRRTARHFLPKPVATQLLADLLFYTGGWLFEEEGEDFGRLVKKCSPSPGAPSDRALLRDSLGRRAAGRDYHYCSKHHALARVDGAPSDVGAFLHDVLVGQDWFTDAPLVFFLTCVRERLAWKYSSPRAYRAVHLECGHYCQTLVLVATSLGLGAFQTGAFVDSAIEDALGIDGVGEFMMYVAGAGYPRPGVSYDRVALRLSEHLPDDADVALPDTIDMVDASAMGETARPPSAPC